MFMSLAANNTPQRCEILVDEMHVAEDEGSDCEDHHIHTVQSEETSFVCNKYECKYCAVA